MKQRSEDSVQLNEQIVEQMEKYCAQLLAAEMRSLLGAEKSLGGKGNNRPVSALRVVGSSCICDHRFLNCVFLLNYSATYVKMLLEYLWGYESEEEYS